VDIFSTILDFFAVYLKVLNISLAPHRPLPYYGVDKIGILIWTVCINGTGAVEGVLEILRV
jgi:hypothetical protein